ncbi:SusC/RagA family TonB-linked outer membrane protein [Pedobacter rhodius]|uniref:TonB-dependent receptor n=1 Tax=Pedobacter rhodius TaxID=3004098 RepID=A0ABT4KUG0_9SPHI|nr:TonB-dependent receptor [Pedobacter sp. SJ11]MCZ4222574.1 TonB-dependent receptor [Pedobacter sp. SJ11]
MLNYLIGICATACFFLISEPLMAQQQPITVSGKVTSSTGEVLPGVSIVVKGSQTTASSDGDGNYKIAVPNSNSVLVFSFVGFKAAEIQVGNRTVVNAKLTEQTQSLDDVVVVAYGNTTQRSSTGALQTVNGKELQDIPAAQVTQKLQGKLAGVQINQASGKPGLGLQVRIRGGASISTGNAPLYVVDGFPIAGDISNINPDEIENITVLKDAASTSLYGSRAAFGVVVVTTKTAKSGQTNISANVYTGTQQVPKKGRPDMMNGTEWAQFKKEYYEDLGQPVPAALQNPSQYGEGVDWYDAMLRSAPITNYSVSINTNKENFSNAVVAGYFKQDGVLLNSNYERFSVRVNSVFKLNEKLKLGLNLAPTHTVNNSPSTDGMFFGGGGLINNALLTPPILNYQNPDGSYPVSVTTPGITSFPTPNWVRSIQDITNKSKDNRILSNGYLEYEPIPKLVLKSSINVDFAQSLFHSFQPSTASRGFASAPSALSANLFDSNYQYLSWLSENTIGYSKQIKDHNFDILGGFTKQKYRSDYSTISGSNFPDDRIETISAALIKNNSTSDIQEWSLVSFLAKFNYSYKGKYLLAASIRRDGSSRFGVDKKWGNFPSVSAGWVVSEESFLQNFKPISFLKIRGSYGITGNNNLGNYQQYASVASAVNSPFGSTTASGIAVNSLGNTQLSWETTKQLDLGVDLAILNNRINFTYDYYTKKTSNLLFSLSVPRESGFSSFTGNVGEIKFWGHEFALTTNNLVGNFKWNTNFNIAFSDNKVLALSSLSNDLYVSDGTARTITRVGERIGQFWGLIQDGVYKDQADFNNSPKSVNSQVGTIKFRDLNGDGVIKYGDAEGDRTVIGNPFPKFVFGFTNSFAYKNFDLSIVASGSYGNDIARMMDEGTTNLDGVFNVLKEVKDRWRSPQNPGAGKYGKTTASTGDDRAQFHTRFVQDGSYLTIKNIALGYSLPVEKVKWLKSVRVFTSVQQAFVFTNYDGINPEIGTDLNGNAPSSLKQGLDYSAYPVPRTFTFGLNVNLK